MSRIIEIDDPGRNQNNESSGEFGGGILLVILLLIFMIMLFLGSYDYEPWSVNTSVVTTPFEGGSIPFSNGSYVTADNLNLRVRPNYYSDVTYVLPRGTRVDLLGESYQEPYGDLWLRVRVQIFDGWQYGWVNRQYIA